MCFPSICEEEIPSSLHKQIICGASGRAARKCCGAALNSTCVMSRSTDLGIQTWKSTSTVGTHCLPGQSSVVLPRACGQLREFVLGN